MGAIDGGFVAYLEGLRDGLEPDPAMWVDEWSDAHMVIPKKTGAAESGKYRTDRTPAAREVMRALSPAHPARRVVVMAASQLMKTQVGLNWTGANIHQAPANILVLLPTANIAKRVSHRIEETIKAVPPLKARVAPPRSRDSKNTIDTKEFDGGTLYITTAGSASNLAEIPARYVWGDEIDRWELNIDDEGDPVALAEARTSTFQFNAKIYFSSTPTVEGESRIDALFREGNQHIQQVPCPHCGHFHFLDWDKSARWDEKLRRAWFVCPECGAEIDEHHKAMMLPAAKWVATAEGDGETWSYHMPAQYAPLGWLSWLAMARQFVKAKAKQDQGSPEEMQVFVNTRLAKVFKREAAQLASDVLRSRPASMPIRTVPANCFALTAGVDTQDNRLEVSIWAWGPGEECAIVDVVQIWGDPSLLERLPGGQPTVWERLDDQLLTDYPHPTGAALRVEAAAVDTGGHHTHEVYTYCRRAKDVRSRRGDGWHLRRTYAVQGRERPGQPVRGKPTPVDINLNGRIQKQGVKLWGVGTAAAKDWWYSHLKMQTMGPGYVHLAAGLPDEWFAQMTAEKRVLIRTARGTRMSWVRPNGARNEAWDCAVYALFAAHALDLPRWSANTWASRIGEIAARVEAPTPTTPAPPPAPPTNTGFGSSEWANRW